MPELGKATYFLIFDTAQAEGAITGTEKAINTSTQRIGASMGVIEGDARAMAAGVSTSAGKIVTAQGEIAVASEETAVKSSAAAVKTESAWSKTAATIKRKGAIGGGMGGLIGLGAAYLVIKGGITWLKDANEATLQVNAALKATGSIAGVTTKHTEELSTKYERLTGAEKGATLSMESLLLGFKNIRNVGPGANAVFDRTVAIVEDIGARTGRNVKSIAVQLGKAIQDPTKYLGLLGRTGVTFTKAQQAMVIQLAKTKGTLAAQKFVLTQLEARYKGAAAAAGKSFTGQLRIARAEMDANSAQIITAFIPAFVSFIGVLKTVSTFMARHKTLLKDLILAYVAFRIAMFGARTAIMAVETAQKIATGVGWLYNKMLVTQTTETTVLADEQLVLAGAEMRGAEAMTAQRIAAGGLAGKLSGAGKFSLYGGALLAGFAIGTLGIKLLHLGPTFQKFGGWIEGVTTKLGLMSKASSKGALNATFDHATQKALANAYRAAVAQTATIKDKGLRAKLEDKIVKNLVGPGYTFRDAQDFASTRRFGGKDLSATTGLGPHRAPVDTTKYAKAPPQLLPAINKAADLIPLGLRTAEYKALSERGAKGLRDQQSVYKREETFLRALLAKVKGNSTAARVARAKIYQAIDSVVSSETSTGSKLSPKTPRISDILTPSSINKRIFKASLTKGLSDDKAAWEQEKGFLEKLIRSGKLHGDNLRSLYSKLTSVTKTIASLTAKIGKSAQQRAQDARDAVGYKLAIQLDRAQIAGNSAKVAAIQKKIQMRELKIMKQEEDDLKKRAAQKGLSLKKQAALWAKIAALDKKRTDLAKKAGLDANINAKQLQAAMNLRGSFFSQFASNVFHQTPGGLDVNSKDKAAVHRAVYLDQHNHYNEIPGDRFETARKARVAVTAEFAGI